MMKAEIAAFAAVSVAISAVAGETRVELKGEVDAEQAVAVHIDTALYFCTSRSPDALTAELRVLDASGNAVPYAIRPSVKRIVGETKEWHRLSIVSAVETNGELAVEAEWSERGAIPPRFASLKVSTPLSDFDERVAVFADGTRIAEGEIFDKCKFADVRKDEVTLVTGSHRRFKVVFSKPVAQVAASDYEKTVSEDAAGAAVGAATRRRISERAFRVDALLVSVPKEDVHYDPAPPDIASPRAEIRFDGKAKKTFVEFDAAYMPVCGFSIDAKDGNFSRHVRLLAPANGGWREVGAGRIYGVDLPGEKSLNRSIRLGGDLREPFLRVEIDDMDNPGLAYGKTPVTLSVRPFDIVFVAKPGVKYSLAVEKGANRPRYDEHLLDYLLKRRDLKKFEGVWDAAAKEMEKAGGPSLWTTVNPITVASCVAFMALVALSFFLFRSNGK